MPTPTETLWYKLNETGASKSFVDSAGNPNGTALRNASVFCNSAGLVGVGTSCDFDGISAGDGILTTVNPSTLSLTSWSSSFWIRREAGGAFEPQGILVSHDNDGDNPGGISIFVDKTDGDLHVKMPGASGFDLVAAAAIPTATTIHIAVTHNSTACLIYKNGDPTPIATQSSPTTNFANGSFFYIGYGYGGMGASLINGKLDDVRFYANAVLTTSQIALLYNSGNGTETALADLAPPAGGGVSSSTLGLSGIIQ